MKANCLNIKIMHILAKIVGVTEFYKEWKEEMIEDMVEYSTLRLLIWNARQEGVIIYIINPIKIFFVSKCL